MLRGGGCGGNIQIRGVQWRGVTASFLNGWDMDVIPWGQLWFSGDASTTPTNDTYSNPGWLSYNGGTQGGNPTGAGRTQVLLNGGCNVGYMVLATWGYGNTVCVPAACTSIIHPCGIIELLAPPDAESYPAPAGCMTVLYYFLCMVGSASLPNRGGQTQGYSNQAPFQPNLAAFIANMTWWMPGFNPNYLSGYNASATCDPQPGIPNPDPFNDAP
jgi:hypothetical protein